MPATNNLLQIVAWIVRSIASVTMKLNTAICNKIGGFLGKVFGLMNFIAIGAFLAGVNIPHIHTVVLVVGVVNLFFILRMWKRMGGKIMAMSDDLPRAQQSTYVEMLFEDVGFYWDLLAIGIVFLTAFWQNAHRDNIGVMTFVVWLAVSRSLAIHTRFYDLLKVVGAILNSDFMATPAQVEAVTEEEVKPAKQVRARSTAVTPRKKRKLADEVLVVAPAPALAEVIVADEPEAEATPDIETEVFEPEAEVLTPAFMLDELAAGVEEDTADTVTVADAEIEAADDPAEAPEVLVTQDEPVIAAVPAPVVAKVVAADNTAAQTLVDNAMSGNKPARRQILDIVVKDSDRLKTWLVYALTDCGQKGLAKQVDGMIAIESIEERKQKLSNLMGAFYAVKPEVGAKAAFVSQLTEWVAEELVSA